MKKSIAFFAILSIILLMPFQSSAVIKKVAQTGLQFLKVGVGARPTAMGEAFTMVGNDANAIFYNPAGIAKISSHFDVLGNRTNWIADITYDAFALVMNGGLWGNFGISIISSDYGNVIGTRFAATDEGFEETGLLNSGAYAAGLSYARELTDKFAVGGQIKYTAQNLGENLLEVDGEPIENKVSGLAYDFGTIFYPGFKSFRLGMVIRNFSTQFKYQETPFQLPLTFYLGFAMDILDFFGEHPDNSFVVAIDAIHPRDYTERIHLGCEYWYKDMVAIRAGYKFNYDEESITTGIGFKLGGAKLDFAYSDFGVFDSVNRISLGTSF